MSEKLKHIKVLVSVELHRALMLAKIDTGKPMATLVVEVLEKKYLKGRKKVVSPLTSDAVIESGVIGGTELEPGAYIRIEGDAGVTEPKKFLS